MAGDTVERLAVLIEANTKQYASAMAKLEKDTQRAINNSTKAVKSLDGALAKMSAGAKTALATLGIGLGVGALASGVRSAVADLGDLADAAERAGVSAEKLQVLRYALDQGTGSAEEADDALAKFNVTLGKSLTTIQQNDPFARLGVALRDASGHARDAEAVFDDVADRLTKIASPAERAALAAELFGKKSGPDLAALLAPGAASLDDVKKRMQELDLLISNQVVKSGDDLDAKFKEWGQTLDTFYKKAVVGVADAMWYLYDATQAVENQSNKALLSDELDDIARARDKLNDQIIAIQQSNPAGALIGPGKALLDSQLTGLKAQIADLDRQANAVLQRIGELNELAKQNHPMQQTKTLDLLPPPAMTKGQIAAMREMARITDESAAATQRLQDRIEAVRDDTQEFASTFISTMVAGKSATEALLASLARLTEKLADQLLTSGINALLGSFFGGMTGGNALAVAGGAGAVFGGLRAGGGDVDPGKAYIVGEKRPELFVPKVPGTIVPRVGGGGPTFNFAPVIDARGADVAAVARLEQSMGAMQKNFKENVIQAVRSGQSSRRLR
jgi:hypothetical protein